MMSRKEPKIRVGGEVRKFSIFNFQCSILPAFLFVGLAVLSIVVFLSFFSPKPYEPPLTAFTHYEQAGMLEAVSSPQVRARLDEVAALGDRFLGKPGFYATEALIRQHYLAAGLELHEQEILTVAPQTEFAEALTAGGESARFRIYPFMPNFYQPVATPDEGITATLLEVNDEVLKTRPSFVGCFALIDSATNAPLGYGYDYTKYAQLGFEGVIVSHRGGLDAVRWSQTKAMATASPANYVRVAADPGVFDYVGQAVTLRVRVRYQEIPNRTLVGVLKAKDPTGEALVIPCSYDALSILPDRSPGVVQASPVAVQLQLLEGLLPHAESLRRDVIFVAFGGRFMGQDSQDRLVSAIGSVGDRKARHTALLAKEKNQVQQLERIAACTPMLAALAGDAAVSRAPEILAGLDVDLKAFLTEQLQYVLNTIVFERSEQMLITKIAFEKEKKTVALTSPAFVAYQKARKTYDKAFSCAGLGLDRLLRDQAPFVDEINFAGLMEARFDALRRHHETERRHLAQSLEINTVFANYKQVVVLASELIPRESESDAPEALTFTMGRSANAGSGGQTARQALQTAIQELGLDGKVPLHFLASRNYGQVVATAMSGLSSEADVWAAAGYPAYSVVSHGNSYAEFAYPSELPWMRDMGSLRNSLRVFGSVVLSAAYGNGAYKPFTFNPGNALSFSGNVYVANVGSSIIPNYPLAGALVGCAPINGRLRIDSGASGQLLMMSDVYGRYEREYSFSPFAGNIYEYSPNALAFNAEGVIHLVKDQGPKVQRLYTSMKLGPGSMSGDVNIVCFRAVPITLFDLINPQSMRDYSSARFVKTQGLNAFESTFLMPNAESILTSFVAPDEYFYVELRAGSAENELVQATRAFMLGATLEDASGGLSFRETARPGSEIRGRGFLAAETPRICNVAREAAQSMVRVNGQRLFVQDHFGMADALTREFHERSVSRLKASEEPGVSQRDATLRARDAVTYATLNHPVLRENIFEAVAGILWYLGLLVPFAFFFEKLVFGFPDIRKQLSAHVVIFLTAFLLLRFLHPAFAMIRSSVMILLGFIIFLISTGILAMFSSKFKENLEGIRKQRGHVTAAEVNKAGAIMTAFMLGLNNMHRRRLRTMLTCGTLVLITFVMICFTSVKDDIVESSVAVGKAPFSGFVVKNEAFRPVAESEVFALRTKYGDRYRVTPRLAVMGREDWETRERLYPDIHVVRRTDDVIRDARPHSILLFDPEEPLAASLPVRGRWFLPSEATDSRRPVPVLLPLAMAERLGIQPERVEAGEDVSVEINGKVFPVCGLFDGAALDGLLDLDGQNLLPFDIRGLRDLNRLDFSTILANIDDPRLAGDHVILAPPELDMQIPSLMPRILSVAVRLPDDLPPRDAHEEIRQYMEQSGRATYFGLDGFSFFGKRARESSFVGLVDMLIPLIIAAITVLNTIRGSVYERKEEIFVYNAVGIAPRHIFFMFFAEAFVYAVVGSVLGYILSQGTGKLLTALNLTGGLNMTFTSLGTIYASLAIAGSVFLSTWFPARTAMKIASPGDDLGWQLPKPEGDRLRFRLPFTFDWHDRIAVLAFFRRYFIDHGEGSSGQFFTGNATMGIAAETDPLNNDGYIPAIRVPIWLKPFDLGVSQELQISLPTDSETGEFVAEILLTRQSGTLENWKRLNRIFVGLLRTHFLHWRAVAPEERFAMFAETQKELNVENLTLEKREEIYG